LGRYADVVFLRHVAVNTESQRRIAVAHPLFPKFQWNIQSVHHRVGIYARVSTKDKGQVTENQLRQLRAFAESQGWTIYREFIDRESGATDEREQFQAMFLDASQRRFDVLLFWALDRLSREGVLETLQHLNRLTSYGVGYRSFTAQYFDSCGIFRDAVIAIIATVAKQERVRLSQRVKAGLETARSKGKRLGRPQVAVDASLVATLRQRGHSWPHIARELGIGVGTAYRIGHGLPALTNIHPSIVSEPSPK
jgi:DNA invertase Pin-like site-specific DNA recombinase